MGYKYWYGKQRTVEVGISAVNSGSTVEVPVFVAPFRCKIKKASIVPQSAITGVDTNNMVLGFYTRGIDGSSTANVASVTFSNGNNASAYAEKDLGAVSNGDLPLATVITFYKDENGSGMDMPNLLAKLEVVRV